MQMPRLARRTIDWLEHRTGIETAVKEFLYEDIPASSGWHQVLGSVAMFSFMVQAVTGILLAFNYAPTPGDAWNSVRYIMQELTGGSLIRGLHHWGASLMIIIVVMHMLQVFIWGAYKKPREATWLVGCVLLLVTLAFGLTGYLLPWDNRAYWGTVVTTQISSSPPVIGPYVARLMGLGPEGGVGVVTFSRFYAMHVLLLPPLTLILVGVHVYLVRKHGVMPSPDDRAPRKKFFPEQVFKDTIAIFIVFCVLFSLAAVAKAPLGRLADPTDTSFIPRPEWYFLFLFQTLKLFEGPLEILGSVILPNLAILLLFIVPFIDRGKVTKALQRPVAIGVVAVAALGWAGLTAAALKSTPPVSESAESMKEPEPWQQLSPVELSGIGYFRQESCGSCHPGGKGKGTAPDLTKGVKKSAAQLIEHMRNPSGVVPGSQMPAAQLNTSQLNTLAAFMLKINSTNAAAINDAPQFAIDGALLYQKNQCGACHQVNGVGMKKGPALNGIASRRDKKWLVDHFNEPAKLSPGTTMPPYKFSTKEMETMTSYLLAIPNQS
jgi:ubiquinol-cytochrome c reductase cytochrome b subunit